MDLPLPPRDTSTDEQYAPDVRYTTDVEIQSWTIPIGEDAPAPLCTGAGPQDQHEDQDTSTDEPGFKRAARPISLGTFYRRYGGDDV